jgi:uroporphyrin-III C-methyltransferase/precorrin-2 dehydrogenase/sirohydrochlorin ferrochelatase
MQVFMAALPLSGAKIVLTGPGEAAIAKTRLFRDSPARVIWFTGPQAVDVPSDIADFATVERRHPGRRVFRGATLAFIGEEDPDLSRRMARRARGRAKQVNIIDSPGESDFQTPALVDRGGVVVGVATGGAAPVLAVDIRSAVEAVLPKNIGALADLARELRGTVKSVISEFDDRRRYWQRSLRGPARDKALAGDLPGARREMLQALNETVPAQGVVHLVGAGPGDPDLLTVKAMRLLREADVIVHDRLASPDVIDRARRDAVRIDVGKTKGRHPVPQDEITDILIREAQAGKRVVRLKGGDPFIFGRGGEELEALKAAGVEAHVTPGISAALACAASSGVPLTHRDHAQAVTFASGVVKAGGEDVDYAALAAANHTSVFYMGVGAAGEIQAKLVAAGRDPGTPVAIIENGTHANERRIPARLGALADTVAAQGVSGPAIIIIGETAAVLEAGYAPELEREDAA